MSLAQDLVNSLAKAGVETEEDLTTLVIDHYTRTINIPKGITTLGVESDDEVLRLNFKMPRYLGTVDLYNFNIRINYINANGEDDVYQVTDKTIIGDYVTFSWLVGPTATAYRGNTKFNVCMVITDSNSVIKQEYNTAIASLPVLEGLETSERVVSEYTDILEQWERRLFGIGDTEESNLVAVSESQQTAIVNKGVEVLATIPADYTSAVKMAEEGVRTKADAIIRNAEGEIITISDSAADPVRGLQIFGKTTQVATTGKQLFDVNTDEIIITNDTTHYRIEGDILAYSASHIYSVVRFRVPHKHFIAGKSYVLECDKITKGLVCQLLGNDVANGQSLIDIRLLNDTKRVEFTIRDDIDMSIFDTYDHGVAYLAISLFFTDEAYVDSDLVVEGLRLYSADNPLDAWEPYTGGKPSPSPEYPQELVHVENPTVTATGVNLFDINHATMRTGNGLTAVINPDGSITVNGTPTGKYAQVCSGTMKLPRGKYYVSGGKNAAGCAYFQLYANKIGGGQKYAINGVFVVDGTEAEDIHYSIQSGNELDAVNNYTLYPMFNVGETQMEYEPYKHGGSIPSDRIVPGIHVTDGGTHTDLDGQKWVRDEIDFERGVYVGNTHLLDCGTDTFGITKHDLSNDDYLVCYLTGLPRSTNKTTKVGALSTHFPVYVGSAKLGTESCAYVYYNSINSIHISVPTTVASTKEALKQWLIDNEVKFLYPVENHTETSLTTEELAAFKALKTNYPNTTVRNDAGAEMELSYNADTEIWVENELTKRLPRNSSVAPAITNTATGEQLFVSDAMDDYVKGLKIFGKTVHNVTPSVSTPATLGNIGDSGSILVKMGTSEADANPQVMTVSTADGLPGVPVSSGGNYTDANGQQWICDEIDFARGKRIHRILKVVFDGSEDELWAATGTSTSGKYRCSSRIIQGIVKPSADNNQIAHAMSTVFGAAAAATVGTYGCHEGISVDASGTLHCYSNSYNTSDVTLWKNYLARNPMTVLCELATPTETDLTSAELSSFAKLYTNRPITTVTADGAVVSMDYIVDTKNYIDKAFNYQSYGMPVLSLIGDTTYMTKDNAVTMSYLYDGRRGTCTVKWQGNSSLAYDKKNYTIKFDNAFEAKSGWGAQKKYCLKANFIDPSHARNIVSSRLWNFVVMSRGDGLFSGLPQRGAIDGFPIVLSINGEFWGLYTFNIPKDGWMFGLSESNTLTQAIVCAEGTAIDNACSFSAPAKVDETDFSLEFVSDENNSAWVKTSLNRLINACINSDGTDLDTTIAQYLDWQSAIDFHIFTCLIGAYDLRIKNYLLVTLDGTKWYFSPYDLDSTFGLEWTGKGFREPDSCAPTPEPDGTYHKVMKMIATYKKDALKARYTRLRQVLRTSEIHTRFYDFASEIPQTVLNEDWRKWPSIPGTSANNVGQIIDWYRNRIEYIDSKIAQL